MAGRLTPPLMMLVLKGLRLIREDGSWSRAEEESDVSIFNCASLAPALTTGTRGLRRAIEAGLVTNALEAPRIAITNTAASARIDGDATADATAQPATATQFLNWRDIRGYVNRQYSTVICVKCSVRASRKAKVSKVPMAPALERG